MIEKNKRIVIVVGEASGDILGAGLLRELKQRYSDCSFEGIGGPLMIAEGFKSLFPMERLAVMGLVDPLLRLPELLSILKSLKQNCIANPPLFFVGIDSPDFNLRLEKPLKKAGIFTVHYVSPSVWAWRQGRIKTIKKSVDLMLTLFPFEAQFYRDHNVPVSFVGHPLADDIPLIPTSEEARKKLSIPGGLNCIALMPGSRRSEIENLWPVYLNTAVVLLKTRPDLQFLLPAANVARKNQISDLLKEAVSLNPELANKIRVFDGQSHDVMAASDLVITTSGTTTLEAMLLKKPMIVCYKMPKLSFAIISRLVKISYIALPNLLAQKVLVPEFIQDNAVPEDISKQALSLLENSFENTELCKTFHNIHMDLKQDASEKSCLSIMSALETRT